MIITGTPSIVNVLAMEFRDDELRASKVVAIKSGQSIRVSDNFRYAPSVVDALQRGMITVTMENQDEASISDVRAGGVGGTGTPGFVPLWSDAYTLEDGSIHEESNGDTSDIYCSGASGTAYIGGGITVTAGDAPMDGQGGAVTIYAGNASGASGYGNTAGSVEIASGSGNGGALAGNLYLTAGSIGDSITANAGSVYISSGSAGADGTAGDINLEAGSVPGIGSGGTFGVYAGQSFSGTGGGVTLYAGASQESNGGTVDIEAGYANGAGTGGNLYLDAGYAQGTGAGGDASLQAGSAYGPGAGGNVYIDAGSSAYGDGGSIDITSGYGGDGNDGDVTISAGGFSGYVDIGSNTSVSLYGGTGGVLISTNVGVVVAADGAGNVVVGAGPLGESATDGFLYVPSMPGAPTGVPTDYPGRVPMTYDASGASLYFYNGSEWSGIAGGAGTSGYSGGSGYSGEGISGYSGEGTSGYSGEGTSGYSGMPGGTSGYSGFSGFSGSSGVNGAPGGTSGYSGFSSQAGGGDIDFNKVEIFDDLVGSLIAGLGPNYLIGGPMGLAATLMQSGGIYPSNPGSNGVGEYTLRAYSLNDIASLASGTAIKISSGDIVCRWRVALPALSTGSFKAHAGLLYGAYPSIGGVYFTYTDTEFGGNWGINAQASGTTSSDSGVAATVGYAMLKVTISSGTATFNINGSDVGTISTNLPTYTGVGAMVRGTGPAGGTLVADYSYVKVTPSPSRA